MACVGFALAGLATTLHSSASSASTNSNAHATVFSLAGRWRFQLDRANVGIKERWFARDLTDEIRLPGTLPAQGIGDSVSLDTKWSASVQDRQWFKNPHYAPYTNPDNFKFPFWLQPDKYYVGAAWYQRVIEIPHGWAGRRAVLMLERPHGETQVWLDGTRLGSNDSLSTPHEYDLGSVLTAGKHLLTIRVDNGPMVDIGVNSHSATDHTQGNWNGIVGRLEIASTSPAWIDDLQVFPNAAEKRVRVLVTVAKNIKKPVAGVVTLRIDSAGDASSIELPIARQEIDVTAESSQIEFELSLGEAAQLWDEFTPALYRVQAEFHGKLEDQSIQHDRETTFGLRDVSTSGTQFVINGRKTFFRGTLECAIFPKTGHPPTDIDSWKRIIRICKAHGLNLIRFHSWCPPKAAFTAADELGFYYQVEAASWANESTTLGDGKPVDAWVERETNRILKAYGNHPSFLLMAYGNEPGGRNPSSYLSKWVDRRRQGDPRRLYTSAAGWPQIEENQFHVTPDPRIHQWGAGLKSRINGHPPETTTDYSDYITARKVPVVSHEIGQWCVYPDFNEMPKYTGYLKPKNFEIFCESLDANHMRDQAREFLHASGKLQTLCYKEEIESALRTPGMGGFQLLDLHDFPGQGTALVGVLNPFWESKGYVTPQEYRRFCGSTVPLARLRKRVFTTDERLTADIEVAHFGAAPLENAVAIWKLVSDHGEAVAHGEFPSQTISVDNGIKLGRIGCDLRDVSAPARYKLVVAISDANCENDWDIWVYPPQVSDGTPQNVAIVDDLDDRALAILERGGRVLLNLSPLRVKGDAKRGKSTLGFSSIFWNTAWTKGQPPHTLGILCDPKHSAFAHFPTEGHSNWQWWYLINNAAAMSLGGLPAQMRPTVQVIDDWVTNRRLGLLFEARIGSGRLAVCSIDLQDNLEGDPVRRQFRHSLLRYMASEAFNPVVHVTPEEVRALATPLSLMHRLGAQRISADSEELGDEASRAIDGDPKTFWHTNWRINAGRFPHHLQIEFAAPMTMQGFTVMPRQDGRRNGWIKDYAFYVSSDGKTWGEPVVEGRFDANDDPKTISWESPVCGRFMRLEARSGFDGTPMSSLAEFTIHASKQFAAEHAAANR